MSSQLLVASFPHTRGEAARRDLPSRQIEFSQVLKDACGMLVYRRRTLIPKSTGSKLMALAKSRRGFTPRKVAPEKFSAEEQQPFDKRMVQSGTIGRVGRGWSSAFRRRLKEIHETGKL